MKPIKWIRSHLAIKGRDWCMANYDRFLSDTAAQWNPESYSRQVRREARKLREKLSPQLPQAEQSSDVKTPLQSTEYHEVDESQYQIAGIRTNTWGSPTNPNQQVRIDYKPRDPGDITPEEAAERFRELIAGYTAPEMSERVVRPKSGRVLEVAFPDPHIGKRIYTDATAGAPWNAEIARAMYIDAAKMLTAGLPTDYEAVLLPIGNDTLNVDGLSRSTTKGTPQHDGEHPLRSFDVALLTVVDLIYYLSNFGPVHVPMVPGNHDRQMTYLLGWALEAWFREMDNVTIDNAPTLHKSYGRGKWGIVYHHGDRLKPEQLAMLFADAYPDLWARATYREVHQGHLHHSRDGEMRATDESNGVRVRLLPSLVPADEWHEKHRYRALREAQALEWDDEDGLVSSRYYHPRVTQRNHAA
ncbi:MAG: hypothetical protein ACOCU4_08145 [Alkalispirochaeta sp.]